jgi:hypothetical protein
MGSHGRERIEDDEVAARKPAEQALAPLRLGGAGDASAFVARLAMTEPMARAGAVHSLQAGVGNRAVGAMLARERPAARAPSSGSVVVSRPFEVSLAVGPTRAATAPAIRGASPDGKYSHNPTAPEAIPVAEAPGPGAAEAGPAAAEATAGPAAAGGEAAPAAAPAAAEPAAAEGEAPAGEEGAAEVISLPDVVKPELAMVQVCDSIAGIVPYGATIVGGAVPGPTEFGICRFGDVKVTGITVTTEKSVYQVRGKLENTITWGVHPTTDNETDISSDTDADIKAANYTTVADDLTPNKASSGGRPPRSKFWAKDLTEIHEQFHADDVKRLGPGAATSAVSWLSSQTAATVLGVQALVDSLPNRVVQTLAAGMGEPSELRAYGAGAAAYTARADAIRTAGKAGKYK